MSQPTWKLLANLGDASPIDHGGLFVYVDELGNYPPEMEQLSLVSDDPDEWQTHRVQLTRCTFENGILSDNQFHPDHSAWFGFRNPDRPQDSCITDVASFIGQDVDDLIAWLCSDDPLERANGYRAILDYHGWINGDEYPLTWNRKLDLFNRYGKANV